MDDRQLDQEIYRLASEALSGDRPAADILIHESTDSVFGYEARWRDVRSRLKKLPLANVLALLSSLSVAVERGRHPVDAVLQFRLVERLADDSRRLRSLLRRMRESPPRMVVHEEQLAVLARFAMTYCTAVQWPGDGDVIILEIFLSYNSLHTNEVLSRAPDPITQLLLMEIRASGREVDNKGDVMTRFGGFVSWARSRAAHESRHFIDLDSIFEGSTGMSYMDFCAAMMAFYTHFGGAGLDSAGRPAYFPFLDARAFTAQVKHPETLNKWLDLVSIPFEVAVELLKTTPESTSIASLQQFMATPLLRWNDATYSPALRYLPNVAGNGLLFRLGQYLAETQGSAAADHLRGFWGDFLEDYVVDHVRVATARRKPQIFRERPFGKTQIRSSDIMLIDGEDAVFIDVNAKRLNVNESIVALDMRSITRDLEKMVITKIRKIGQRATDFREGRLVLEGVDSSQVRRITGLVVTAQGLARVVGIPEKLKGLMPAIPAGLDQWDFLDLSEAEFLSRAFDGDLDLAGLIADKLADDAGRSRSLTNYFWFRRRELLRERRSGEELLSDEWFQDVFTRARTWGLPGDVIEERSSK